MHCSHIPNCELFPLFKSRAVLQIWRTMYCEGEYARCARFRHNTCAGPIPITLLPNGEHLSASLAAKAKKEA